MTANKITIRCHIAATVNASAWADSFCSSDNGVTWRNATTGQGNYGVAFFDCDDQASAEWLIEEISNDDDFISCCRM